MSNDEHSVRKTRFRNLGVFVLVGIFASGCGVAKVHEFQNITADELVQKSDEFVCDAGGRIQAISTLPVVWIRELKKRDLWECVSEYRRGGGSTRVIIQQDPSQ